MNGGGTNRDFVIVAGEYGHNDSNYISIAVLELKLLYSLFGFR